MQWHKLAIAISGALFAAACTNHTINFDVLPNGSAVPSWNGSALNNSNPSVLTTQYASAGIASLSSAGGGVFALADSTVASQPNTVCPIGVSFGPRDGTGPVTITLAQSTTNVWLTIPRANPEVTISARDANGTVLRTETSMGANATASAQGRRVRLNASGIQSVVLDTTISGGAYCFDDFTWQEPW